MLIFKKKLSSVKTSLKQNGLKITFKKIISKKYRRQTHQINISNFYQFISYHPVGPTYTKDAAPQNTINWFIPPFNRGSGGHLNIFRFISLLEQNNYNCRIILINYAEPQTEINSISIKRKINKWFFPLKAAVYDGSKTIPPAFFSIATSWHTAYAVRNFQTTQHKCYFVQDFEPYFYARGSEFAMAENTYRFGFTAITAGQWLAEKLSHQYHQKTYPIGFSYDTKHYKILPKKNHKAKHVFFYARPPTPRRAFELGQLALLELLKRLPDTRVIFAGWDISNYHIPFRHLNAGTLNINELPDLYNQCDVALVLSFTNLSLLPLELMACGVPVVSNRAPCTEWLLNDDNSMLSSTEPEALADAMYQLLTNQNLHTKIKKNGLATAHASSWEKEALKLATVLNYIADDKPAKQTKPIKNKECCERIHH